MRGRMRLAHGNLVVIFLVLGSTASFLLGHEVGGFSELRTAQVPTQLVASSTPSVGSVPASGGLSNRTFGPKHPRHTPTHGTKPTAPGDDQSGSTSVLVLEIPGSGTITVTLTRVMGLYAERGSPASYAMAPQFAFPNGQLTAPSSDQTQLLDSMGDS